ncbi:MAG: (2Fe-2S)-binding protein [Bacteroidota bacterium]
MERQEQLVSRGQKICKCYHVYEEDIRNAIKESNSFSFEEVQKLTFCSKGCGTCEEEVRAYINEVQNTNA